MKRTVKKKIVTRIVSLYVILNKANAFYKTKTPHSSGVYQNRFILGQLVFLAGQVLMPNGVYSGQKPIKLVNTNTPPNITSTIPHVPVTTPPK